MMTSVAPPVGSKINVECGRDGLTIAVPHGNGGALRFFIGAFLAFWLCGWAAGLIAAGKEVLKGGGGAFLLLWLGGWTVGGAFAGYFLFRVFRPSVPERLILNKPFLSYDSGVPPFKMCFRPAGQAEYWRSMFPKRRKAEFSAEELETLRLRETDAGNRLTVDVGAERVELATFATEIEREWLHAVLREYYS